MYDQDTIKRVMNGDKDAFSKMYNDLSPTIYRQVHDKLQDHAQAREAVRNIFLDVYRYCTQLRDSTLFDEWMASLIRFYTDQNAPERIIQNNPDLQVVWEDISAAIESGEGRQPEEEKKMEANPSQEDHLAELDMKISDVSEDWQNILDNVEKEMDIWSRTEEVPERDKTFPGVDEEVTRLIEELATDDWSPILFPPDDEEDVPVHPLSADPPWMRSWVASTHHDEVQEKNEALSDVSACPESVEKVSTAKEDRPDRFVSADVRENAQESVLGTASAKIKKDDEPEAGKANQKDMTLQNVTMFPGSVALMDRTTAEQNDPPEWLTSGPLPNIDDMVNRQETRITASTEHDAPLNSPQETIMGSVVLQPAIQPDAMQDEKTGEEVQKKQTIELLGKPASLAEREETKTKEAKILYESVHVELDHINSRVTFERVPYEYIPYEEHSREIYDQLNHEILDQPDDNQSGDPANKGEAEQAECKNAEPEVAPADTIFAETSNTQSSGFESVVLPQKKEKKSRAGVILLVAAVLIIGAAVVYAKMAGLI